MSSEMKIGVTNLEGGVKKEWFTIEAGKDNEYRILPPLFSLADKGKYAQYTSVHKVWFKDPAFPNSKARPYSFNCIKRVNKNKEVEVHCPYCDKYDAAKLKHDEGKAKGATPDQLKDFNMREVQPYQTEQKFLVNAVNAAGKVGLLPLGIKAFQALQAELVSAKTKLGIDATGMEGLYFNFSKTQKFKGDRDTAYGVQLAQEVTKGADGRINTSLKQHFITQAFIEVIKAGARDLTEVFKTITVDQIHQLASVTEENKKNVIESVFGKFERKDQSPVSSETTTSPWNSAPAVLSPSTLVATTPESFSFTSPVAAPAPIQAPLPVMNPSSMSDADFLKSFG